MTKLGRNDRVLARRQDLLEAALRTIRLKGANTSMDDIAAEAGITRPILYRYFGDRKGLIIAVSEYFSVELLEDLKVAFENEVKSFENVVDFESVDLASVIGNVIGAFLDFVNSDPDLYRFLVSASIASEEYDDLKNSTLDFVETLCKNIAKYIADLLVSTGRDSGAAEPFAYGIVGMVHFVSMWWLDRGVLSKSRLVDYMSTLLAEGFKSERLKLTNTKKFSVDEAASLRRQSIMARSQRAKR